MSHLVTDTLQEKSSRPAQASRSLTTQRAAEGRRDVFKILHVSETALGGVGSYIEEIAPLQSKRYGAEAVRVLLPHEHARHFKGLQAASVQTFVIGNAGRLATAVKAAWLAWAEIRRWQPDVVHIHSTYAGFALRPLLALMPGRPQVVYCSHGWAFDREGSHWYNAAIARMERWWSRWCDAVVCISDHDRRSALRAGIEADRLVVVMNGIAEVAVRDARQQDIDRWPAGRMRVLFVGRLDRQKGIDIFREAMQQLGDEAAAVVIGSAVVSDGAPVEAEPTAMKVLGWLPRDEIVAMYATADVLVMPSRWEGFGLVALEAMRSGCAVVASRVGGLPEVVEDGVSGVLVEPGDAEEMARRLKGLDAAQLRSMGAAGRARFLRLFRIERVADELDTLYRRLLQRRAQHVART